MCRTNMEGMGKKDTTMKNKPRTPEGCQLVTSQEVSLLSSLLMNISETAVVKTALPEFLYWPKCRARRSYFPTICPTTCLPANRHTRWSFLIGPQQNKPNMVATHLLVCIVLFTILFLSHHGKLPEMPYWGLLKIYFMAGNSPINYFPQF